MFMKLVKVILIVVLLGVVALGCVYVAENRGIVHAGTFANLTDKISGLSTHLPSQVSTQTVTNSVQMLSSQTGKMSTASGAVLGTVNAIERQDTPLPQRAFEYARYAYCQAVVSDYQQRQQSGNVP